MADVDIDAVLESLAEHGDLSVVQRGEMAENLPWVAVFTSPLDAAEVAESLAFAVPQDSFRINVNAAWRRRAVSACFSRPVRNPTTGSGWRGRLRALRAAAWRWGSSGAATGIDAAKPAARAGLGGESSIRVNIDKVDLLLNLVGELVITQSMLEQSGTRLHPVAHERLLSGIGALQRNARELQEAVMSIRMTPIAFVFNRFPRVVRDLAGRLGKRVELQMSGENTELDKGFIEKLSDPLTHLVRNSLIWHRGAGGAAGQGQGSGGAFDAARLPSGQQYRHRSQR